MNCQLALTESGSGQIPASYYVVNSFVRLTVILCLATIFASSVWAVDCLPEDITLSSQSDVSNFQANYGPCDQVTGVLRIEGDDISSLSGLSELKQIYNLDIWNNPLLINLQGFSGLEVVAGLDVHGNPSLADLQGLTALDQVGSLYIAYNASLISMKGLEAVELLTDLIIRGNSSLRNMEGLSSLARVSPTFPTFLAGRGFSGISTVVIRKTEFSAICHCST